MYKSTLKEQMCTKITKICVLKEQICTKITKICVLKITKCLLKVQNCEICTKDQKLLLKESSKRHTVLKLEKYDRK